MGRVCCLKWFWVLHFFIFGTMQHPKDLKQWNSVCPPQSESSLVREMNLNWTVLSFQKTRWKCIHFFFKSSFEATCDASWSEIHFISCEIFVWSSLTFQSSFKPRVMRVWVRITSPHVSFRAQASALNQNVVRRQQCSFRATCIAHGAWPNHPSAAARKGL